MSAARWGTWAILTVQLGGCPCAGTGDTAWEATQPRIQAWPEQVDCGRVLLGQRATCAVRLRNVGDGPLRLAGAQVRGDTAFSLDGLPARTLRPGAELSVTVSFLPLEPGTRTAVLAVDNSSTNAPELDVPLGGEGTPLPECEDGNPCTQDVPDAEHGECLHLPSSGTCDDGNACTTGDTCQDGRCVGETVPCDDGVDCTVDACDPGVGCVFTPVNARCEDGNACTQDVCSAQGCEHQTLDGTACGPMEACARMWLCWSGACRDFPVPDGMPCDDGCGTGTAGAQRQLHTAQELGLGLAPQLVVETNGTAHVLYVTQDGVLMHSRARPGVSPEVGQGAYHGVMVPTASTGTVFHAAADAHGTLHVAWRADSGELRYGRREPYGIWRASVFIGNPSLGLPRPWTLEVTPDGRVFVVFSAEAGIQRWQPTVVTLAGGRRTGVSVQPPRSQVLDTALGPDGLLRVFSRELNQLTFNQLGPAGFQRLAAVTWPLGENWSRKGAVDAQGNLYFHSGAVMASGSLHNTLFSAGAGEDAVRVQSLLGGGGTGGPGGQMAVDPDGRVHLATPVSLKGNAAGFHYAIYPVHTPNVVHPLAEPARIRRLEGTPEPGQVVVLASRAGHVAVVYGADQRVRAVTDMERAALQLSRRVRGEDLQAAALTDHGGLVVLTSPRGYAEIGRLYRTCVSVPPPPEQHAATIPTCAPGECTPGTGWVGTPCTLPSQCAGDHGTPACLSEAADGWPGGACSQRCALAQPDCPAGTFCWDAHAAEGLGLCMAECRERADCRDGFDCMAFTAGHRACAPRTCWSQCSDGRVCVDETDGLGVGLCHAPPTCGNGVLDPGEDCDPPDLDRCDAWCHAATFSPPGWTCDPGAYDDGWCDCGCGVPDRDCAPGVACAFGG